MQNKVYMYKELQKSIHSQIERSKWLNIGGQLISSADVYKLKNNIKRKKINSWAQVHDYYRQSGTNYKKDKLVHAYTSLLEIENITSKQFTKDLFKSLLEKSIETKTWIAKRIYDSRAKDYSNPFRKMVYETSDEMKAVIGRIEDNQFIQDQLAEADNYKKSIRNFIKKIK